MKNEVGMNPAIAKSLRWKLFMMSGISGPKMFVMNEMVNQNIMIRVSCSIFFFIVLSVEKLLRLLSIRLYWQPMCTMTRVFTAQSGDSVSHGSFADFLNIEIAGF